MTCSVIHLVREANGPEPLQAFLAAYRATTDHPLTLACKGFTDGDISRPPPNPLGGDRGPQVIMMPDSGYDIGSYRVAATWVDTDYVCFLNSFSRPLQRGWLDLLRNAAMIPRVGIAGCTGSLEGVEGAPFPNPHIRSNAFVMRRDLFLSLDLPEPQTKQEACMLEAGPRSITRQVLDRGLDAVVVSAGGPIWNVQVARDSNTFRWGGQVNLLVADNRTEAYEKAGAEEQAYLRKLAWGES